MSQSDIPIKFSARLYGVVDQLNKLEQYLVFKISEYVLEAPQQNQLEDCLLDDSVVVWSLAGAKCGLQTTHNFVDNIEGLAGHLEQLDEQLYAI